jgi:ubiquinone/menaquinone biosynthesis C-methylase UbiE
MFRLRQRAFAFGYDFLGKSAERGVYREFREFAAGEASGRILEIGAGTGANLPYYPAEADLTLSDPNPFMLDRLERKAAEQGISVRTDHFAGEELPYDDDSFNSVVGTLVMCSVSDPARSIAEIARVLTLGGEFRFMEHVRGEGFTRERFQDLMTPVWRAIGDGCHPNRTTVSTITGNGLEIVETRPFSFGPYPIRPHIAGVARKAA